MDLFNLLWNITLHFVWKTHLLIPSKAASRQVWPESVFKPRWKNNNNKKQQQQQQNLSETDSTFCSYSSKWRVRDNLRLWKSTAPCRAYVDTPLPLDILHARKWLLHSQATNLTQLNLQLWTLILRYAIPPAEQELGQPLMVVHGRGWSDSFSQLKWHAMPQSNDLIH